MLDLILTTMCLNMLFLDHPQELFFTAVCVPVFDFVRKSVAV
jgi:hypothetical protein